MKEPTQAEMNDYMMILLKIWERTPAKESAVFNDERVLAHTQWGSGRVREIRERCSVLGWINYSYEGAKDYTLTAAGLDLARGARRKQVLSKPDVSKASS